jgi:hypothetical protein
VGAVRARVRQAAARRRRKQMLTQGVNALKTAGKAAAVAAAAIGAAAAVRELRRRGR